MSAATKRLFVALWPDAQTREQMAVVQQHASVTAGLNEGAVAWENLHLTLLFLGNVAAADIDNLQNCLARVAATPFELLIDRWGQFIRPGILWVGPSTPPASLLRLQSDTAAACRDGFGGGSKHYTPHVTLFRKLRHLPELPAFDPLCWHIRHFVLVQSRTRPQGVRYQVLQEFVF